MPPKKRKRKTVKPSPRSPRKKRPKAKALPKVKKRASLSKKVQRARPKAQAKPRKKAVRAKPVSRHRKRKTGRTGTGRPKAVVQTRKKRPLQGANERRLLQQASTTPLALEHSPDRVGHVSEKTAYARPARRLEAHKGKLPAVPRYAVTSEKERFLDTHLALRKVALKNGSYVLPDQRVHIINREGKKGIHQSVNLGIHVNEGTLEDLLYQTRRHLEIVKKVSKRQDARYYVSLHMTQYGLELYGSDKAKIAEVDDVSTDALHWVVDGTPGYNETERLMEVIRHRIEHYLSKGYRTTIVVESVEVTAIYPED